MLRLHDKIAIQCADKRYTYDDLSRYAQCYADAYGSIGKESKVAIFAPNSPEWIFAFYGIIHAKAIAVPIDELATPDELAYVLKDAAPDVMVTTSERSASVQKVIQEAGVSTRVVVMEDVPV
ncbi:MAG: acyl--CoA ligase, partial [Bacteroidales bacterium]|nr:acyl--CoA ligase [Bacteroidales bacterium]